MPYRDFPLIYGSTDESYNEEQLREMLKLGDQDTCADGYGHYVKCIWAVVELKGRHMRNGIEQLEATVKALKKLGKPINKAIIVADTFGNERGMFRRGKILYIKRGERVLPITVDSIIVEGWQPSEIRERGMNNWLSR